MSVLGGIALGIFLVLVLNVFLLYQFVISPGLKSRLPQRKKPEDLPKAKRLALKFQNHTNREESCEWLNKLVQQIWVEMVEDGTLHQTIKTKVLEELVDLRRTPAAIFLVSDPTQKGKRKSETYAEIHDIWIGKKPPSLSKISFLSKQTKDSDVIFFADLSFEGLALTLSLNTLLEIPIAVQVNVKKFEARLAAVYSPEWHHTMSISFMEKPKLDISIETAIFNDKNSFLSKLANRLAAMAVPIVLQAKFIQPNVKTVWFLAKPQQPPYPWEVDDDSKLYTVPATPTPNETSNPVPAPIPSGSTLSLSHSSSHPIPPVKKSSSTVTASQLSAIVPKDISEDEFENANS